LKALSTKACQHPTLPWDRHAAKTLGELTPALTV
jgi:hypothetical protein